MGEKRSYNYRGGSRNSGKGVHMYKGVGFVLLILSNFLIETKLFQFHRIFKNGGQKGEFDRPPPPEPPLDPPLD